VGSKRPSSGLASGCNGVHVLSMYPPTCRSLPPPRPLPSLPVWIGRYYPCVGKPFDPVAMCHLVLIDPIQRCFIRRGHVFLRR
jgi:hypothetical protein